MIIDFDSGYNKKIVIALGFFDSVHRGHRMLINRSIEIASAKGILSAVFTFAGNPYKAIGLLEHQVYTFRERVDLLYRIGVDHIISAIPSIEFMNLTPLEFLDKLTRKYDIDTIICGDDYCFGKGASGDIKLLTEYCKSKGINIVVSDMLLDNDVKISSSNIKKLIIEGNIIEANALLGSPYMVMGDVIRGRGKGREMGFPTANLQLSAEKIRLSEGVYATSVIIKGVQYEGLTNVGGRPTFDDLDFNIETFVLDYEGSPLYNSEIKLYFIDRIRSITKYQNMEELSLQIKFDLIYSKSIERKII